MKLKGGQEKRVVIVGGSFAGLAASRKLQTEKVSVTIVEPRDYFEYTPGILHIMARSGSEDIIFTPITTAAKNAMLVQGRFVGLKIEENDRLALVQHSDGTVETIPFDALIIASGRKYASPIRPSQSKRSDRLAELELVKDRFELSGSIAIIGGGLIGVELAAELAHRYKSKKAKTITLINRSTLLGTLPPAAGRLASSWFRRNGVQVIFDAINSVDVKDKGDPSNLPRVVHLKSGSTVEADLVIDCTNKFAEYTGQMSKPHATVPSMHHDNLQPYDESGFVEVNDHLQTTVDPFVFAAGDVIKHKNGVGFASTSRVGGLFATRTQNPLLRNAHLAESQGELAAMNILELLNNRETVAAPLKVQNQRYSYPEDIFGSREVPLLACVSLGPRDGIVVFNNFVFGGIFFGVVSAMVKFMIERSKISEIRNENMGRMFWGFAHVVSNFIHCLHLFIRAKLILVSAILNKIRRRKASNSRDALSYD
jgi:NADH dehydrogenase FAD-containing subunit